MSYSCIVSPAIVEPQIGEGVEDVCGMIVSKVPIIISLNENLGFLCYCVCFHWDGVQREDKNALNCGVRWFWGCCSIHYGFKEDGDWFGMNNLWFNFVVDQSGIYLNDFCFKLRTISCMILLKSVVLCGCDVTKLLTLFFCFNDVYILMHGFALYSLN